MPVLPSSFTTTEIVQELLGESTGNNVGFIERIINGVSQAMRQRIGRPLHYATNHSDSVACLDGINLFVDTYPLTSITSIVLRDFSGATVETYDPSQYNILDGSIGQIQGYFQSTQHHLHHIAARVPVGSAEPRYLVTYAGGYVTPAQLDADNLLSAQAQLPADIHEAALQSIVARFKDRTRNSNVASASVPGVSLGFRNPNQLIGIGPSYLLPETISVCDAYRTAGYRIS